MIFRILTLAFLTPLFALAQKSYTISGNIKGIPDNTVLELRNDDVSKTPLNTCTVKAGKFEFKGTLQDPILVNMGYQGNPQRLFIFLDYSKLSITGKSDSLNFAKVSGSPTHDQFLKFNREFNQLFERLSILANDINTRKPDTDGKIRAEYDALISYIQNKGDAFIDNAPSSPVSPLVALILTQLNTDISITEARYNKLKPESQNGFYGKILATNVAGAKVGAIGSEAMEFVQNDVDGKPVSLSSFRGKFVLIDFWASWCRPCRMENPNVVEAFNRFKTKNFTVLGVSLDKDKNAWLKAIEDDHLTWTHVSDLKFWSNEVAQKYRVESIPQNFLIDPNGKIVGKNLRGEELLSKLNQLIN
ncbi:MAG: redoxin domain-containing protein [Chitinophagaceae bacterium]